MGSGRSARHAQLCHGRQTSAGEQVDPGGYLLELLYLDDLARDQVYEFMLVVAPLRIDRGLGSPINPIALT